MGIEDLCASLVAQTIAQLLKVDVLAHTLILPAILVSASPELVPAHWTAAAEWRALVGVSLIHDNCSPSCLVDFTHHTPKLLTPDSPTERLEIPRQLSRPRR